MKLQKKNHQSSVAFNESVLETINATFETERNSYLIRSAELRFLNTKKKTKTKKKIQKIKSKKIVF